MPVAATKKTQRLLLSQEMRLQGCNFTHLGDVLSYPISNCVGTLRTMRIVSIDKALHGNFHTRMCEPVGMLAITPKKFAA